MSDSISFQTTDDPQSGTITVRGGIIFQSQTQIDQRVRFPPEARSVAEDSIRKGIKASIIDWLKEYAAQELDSYYKARWYAEYEAGLYDRPT